MAVKQNKGLEGELRNRVVSGAYGTVDSEDDSPRVWKQSVPDPCGFIPKDKKLPLEEIE